MEGEHAEFLKTHVTGVLSHGHNMAWAVIDLLRWPADANPTINTLLIALKDIVEKVSAFQQGCYKQRGLHSFLPMFL